MSTNKLESYTEEEAKNLLNDICNIFGIGSSARTASVIMTNVKNAVNDEFCKNRGWEGLTDKQKIELADYSSDGTFRLYARFGNAKIPDNENINFTDSVIRKIKELETVEIKNVK